MTDVDEKEKDEKMESMSVDELIKKVWKKEKVEFPIEEAQQLQKDNFSQFQQEGIVLHEKDGKGLFTKKNIPVVIKTSHDYLMPEFSDEVRCLMHKAVIEKKGMCNILLTGAAGTGKTEFVKEIANEFGCKVIQVNGSEGLTSADFYGTMAVRVDEKTGQNFTYFDKGPLYLAFIEGTQLDENGHQVFNEKGEPIVVGEPAIFFLDEFAAMLPEVFLGVFNRAMELPREHGKGRSMEISLDNGRLVKSHPGMVMFLAGNTVGTGNSGKYQMGYTAQGNKMDESTRNRITAFYQFGYNREAEEVIATGMLNDDYQVMKLMLFRDEMRKMFKKNNVETLVTTRTIVAVCDVARSFRDGGMNNWMERALRVVVFNGLPETDHAAFNQQILQIWSTTNFMEEDKKNKRYDYMV